MLVAAHGSLALLFVSDTLSFPAMAFIVRKQRQESGLTLEIRLEVISFSKAYEKNYV